MDISKTIAEMKQDPTFAKNVGMVLVHNGTVRGWSRGDHSPVNRVDVVADQAKIEQIRCEIEKLTGIYKVVVEARSGVMQPGDDLLFLIVAGNIRENVKPAFAKLLDRIKAEAISKKETFISD
ncbi:molybdenum cofactor biosynthesis protein [Candidatus Woesearchaeota archaeon]|nr:MAG: molybdenum cofactor biosynthesis protein [Candidatus Woesearchaeota archaeon]